MEMNNQIKVDFIDHMGDDLTVVNSARVSFNKESWWESVRHQDGWFYDALSDKDTKLIRYLAKHKHYSPFGHCFTSFRVTAPVFVRAQLVKHEYLRVNEVSRRYVDDPPEFFYPELWRGAPVDKKQGSTGDYPLQDDANQDIRKFCELALGYYNFHIKNGMAPEQARMFLPQNMMTSWYWSGSLDAFANMCKLRLGKDAQYETQLVAEEVSKHMKSLFPVSWEALING